MKLFSYRPSLIALAYIKFRPFDRAWTGFLGDVDTPANDNVCTDYATRPTA